MHPDRIPLELRQKRKWVSFRFAPARNGTDKPRKIPIIPGTDQTASPTDPSTWRSFEDACNGGNPAYCITEEDGLILLDLDSHCPEELADQLMTAFDGTYMEVSASQAGVHILMRGKLSTTKDLVNNKVGVGIYSRNRFCIFTGVLIEGQGTIKDADPLWLTKLENEFQAGTVQIVDLTEIPQREEDPVIIEKAREKHNKFTYLWQGDWQAVGDYPSQSEADHALIGMLAEESACNSQVKRLFERSGLYRPEKPHKFRYSIQVIRSKQQKDLEADDFTRQLLSSNREKMEKVRAAQDFSKNDERIYQLPEGLLRELFHAYQDWAVYPLKEASLIAALVTALALFSRRFQTEGTSPLALNMWLFLIGESGVGKEIVRKGPDQLFRQAGAPMQGVMGGELRSSPGIDDCLKASPRHIAYHNECDGWLRNLCDERSAPCWHQVRTRLMDSYTKGSSSMVLRSVKVEKGASKEYDIERPCLSILGDCVSEPFYRAVGTSQIGNGFLPRFTVLEVDADSISIEKGPQKPFPKDLLERIKNLALAAMQADVNQTWTQNGNGSHGPQQVPAMRDARQRLDEYAREIRLKFVKEKQRNESLVSAVPSRMAEKVEKLAALSAVCRSQTAPRVTLPDVEWAILFVRNTDGRMISRLASGEFDPAMHQQLKNVRRYLETVRFLSPAERSKTGFFPSEKLCHSPELVTWGWLRNACGKVACFKHDKRGVQVALTHTLKDMELAGDIILVPPEAALTSYGYKAAVIVNVAEPGRTLEEF